jgi:integrase
MRVQSPHKPFVLYQKETKTGPVWYARFWDEAARRYAVTRSTGVIAEGKKQRRYEAEQAAREMLPRIRFVPQAEKAFIQYLESFWDADSPYVREAALIKKRPLSAAYIHTNHEDVGRHIAPFPPFRGIALQELTPALIRDWLLWASDRGMSGRKINIVLQIMRVPVRYALERAETDRDPFRSIGKAVEMPREKGILTPVEVTRLITAPVTDPCHRLAVMLGVLCGMRMGEVRGLQWGDIRDGLIHIRHNWINGEGMKAPKCKGGAVRENPRAVPLPSSVAAVLENLRGLNPAPDSFVMQSFRKDGEPVGKEYFRYVMGKELAAVGIPGIWKGKEAAPEGYVNEQKRRNLTFHGLRHTFITLGRLAGITDLEIRALAGHKSGAMTENYSHAAQVLDFTAAREKLEKAVGGM